MNTIGIYFSDFFDINEEVIEDYGAVNISLINDLPLFIDPFLLFNSVDKQFQNIHLEIINYLLFLKDQALRYPSLDDGITGAWYQFPEVKQTWLDFSLDGNSGRGLGREFAIGLHNGLKTIFKDFGEETIPKSPHMEKLCLISPKVGRDKISDFTTNFAKGYLLEFTQTFSKKYLSTEQCASFSVPKVEFNYDTKSWVTKTFYLPKFNKDYVLLTPKTLLTREETFINRTDMIRNLEKIAPTVSDATLRFKLNNYFQTVLYKKRKEISSKEKNQAATLLIVEHPELIDYYLKYKEEKEEEATSLSEQNVQEVKQLFNIQLQELVKLLKSNTQFYNEIPDAHEETKKRVNYLKTVIEDQDGYRIFYVNNIPVNRESDLQVMFRLVWYGSELDVNREVNNGRGPVDYKVSIGARNSTLVEFKLASNSKLKQNLAKQVDVYKKASGTKRAIKVILYFSQREFEKVNQIIRDLELQNCSDIVLIDGRNDNKPSASNAK